MNIGGLKINPSDLIFKSVISTQGLTEVDHVLYRWIGLFKPYIIKNILFDNSLKQVHQNNFNLSLQKS